MSQGSIVYSETTVTFTDISPSRIPDLAQDGRVSSTPGLIGGRYINLGQSPASIPYGVTCTSDDGWLSTATDTDYHKLLDMKGQQVTLNVHDDSNAYCILDDVSLEEEVRSDTDGKIRTQNMVLEITRLR